MVFAWYRWGFFLAELVSYYNEFISMCSRVLCFLFWPLGAMLGAPRDVFKIGVVGVLFAVHAKERIISSITPLAHIKLLFSQISCVESYTTHRWLSLLYCVSINLGCEKWERSHLRLHGSTLTLLLRLKLSQKHLDAWTLDDALLTLYSYAAHFSACQHVLYAKTNRMTRVAV